MRQGFRTLNIVPKFGIFPISLAHQDTLPRVFFDLALNSSPIGRVVFELNENIAPKTARNFLHFVTGFKHQNGHVFSYKNTNFSRILPGRGIWGGDVANGTPISYYGGRFVDENYKISHNKAGILTTANFGGINCNDSRFIITLGPAQWLDKKSVAFGEVIYGLDLIKQIERLGSVSGETSKKVTIIQCGVLQKAEFHEYDKPEHFDIWAPHPNH